MDVQWNPTWNHSALPYRTQHLTESPEIYPPPEVELPLISKFKDIFKLLFILVNRIFFSIYKWVTTLTYRKQSKNWAAQEAEWVDIKIKLCCSYRINTRPHLRPPNATGQLNPWRFAGVPQRGQGPQQRHPRSRGAHPIQATSNNPHCPHFSWEYPTALSTFMTSNTERLITWSSGNTVQFSWAHRLTGRQDWRVLADFRLF